MMTVNAKVYTQIECEANEQPELAEKRTKSATVPVSEARSQC